MLQRPRFQIAAKALILLALALFLYMRLADGTLFFYINQRFMVYTVLAVVGLVAVALSYRVASSHANDGVHTHHTVTWGGLALVLLPVALGVLAPPQPLGAAAIGNREIAVSAQRRALRCPLQCAPLHRRTPPIATCSTGSTRLLLPPTPPRSLPVSQLM